MKEQTRSKHTHSDLSQEKQQCNQQRRPTGAARRGTRTLKQNQLRAQENHSTSNVGDRGGAKRGETHTQAKPTQSPRKPQYIQQRRPRGSKERGEAHTLKQKNTTTVQPTKATEGDILKTTKKDRNEKSQERPYRYSHWHPIDVGENGACAETEIA